MEPHLIVEPDDGIGPVLDFIASARDSLRIKQFTFTEESLIDAVIERSRAGVDVKVMLNAAKSGGERANDDTFARLEDAGVSVAWTNPAFYVTHEKSMVVDTGAAMIATFNLCTKYFTRTRDFGVVTTDPSQVAQIIEVFEADWAHGNWVPADNSGLLWSNSNSRVVMAQFIDTARTHLDIQHPKFVDAVILDRIVAAADRGVKVKVLCGGRHGISDSDVLDTFSSLRTLNYFGIKVHKQKNLRAHAKLVMVDRERALVGSMNIDRSAFDLRRELGVTVDDPVIVDRLIETFTQDWESSRRYYAPDPLAPQEHDETDFPYDPELIHE
ncbi:phospholipase D-like domain-containing protein [Mycolicibacterium iranicum]|uniref:phospholipase D n=1 Tax=Mycolicibacterium iranicum TaxID=912594 RepID=A0A1X1X1C1_MYCIR|nr:phospholipase D-like domain-containing protein [Mycolicibacterium iranicum]MCZ0731737.1 phospholipase D-like domain-containing protein [Mycolicibacterium iranicum]ORV92662.1 cardiolipin synthase [Mycolicibacterium iranicum]